MERIKFKNQIFLDKEQKFQKICIGIQDQKIEISNLKNNISLFNYLNGNICQDLIGI